MLSRLPKRLLMRVTKLEIGSSLVMPFNLQLQDNPTKIPISLATKQTPPQSNQLLSPQKKPSSKGPTIILKVQPLETRKSLIRRPLAQLCRGKMPNGRALCLLDQLRIFPVEDASLRREQETRACGVTNRSSGKRRSPSPP
jgi:hypothetical protein